MLDRSVTENRRFLESYPNASMTRGEPHRAVALRTKPNDWTIFYQDGQVFMNNRQAGRRRGRGNNRAQSNNRNGYDHQNRVDNRARGNAAQMLEKYKKLAQDAQLNGDRVQAEYYHQFADHYFRVLADFRSRQEEGRPQREWRGDDREGGDWRDDERDGETGDDDSVQNEDNDEGEDRRPQRDNDRGDRRDRPERNDRQDRGERSERPERSARPERGERQDRNDRGNRGERTDRNDRSGGRRERPDRNEGRHQQEQGSEAVSDGLDLSILPPAIGIAANDASATVEAEEAKPARKPRARKPKASESEEAVAAAE